jgi:hypothetical protein
MIQLLPTIPIKMIEKILRVSAIFETIRDVAIGALVFTLISTRLILPFVFPLLPPYMDRKPIIIF